jgi:hypothetical protein
MQHSGKSLFHTGGGFYVCFMPIHAETRRATRLTKEVRVDKQNNKIAKESCFIQKIKKNNKKKCFRKIQKNA